MFEVTFDTYTRCKTRTFWDYNQAVAYLTALKPATRFSAELRQRGRPGVLMSMSR